MKLIALFLATLVTACAQWHKAAEPSKEIRWLVASQEVITSFDKCDKLGVLACTVRNGDRCLIFARQPEAETPRFIVEHERKHCDGYDH